MLKICRKTAANQTPEQAAVKKITKKKIATTANPKHLLVMMIVVLSVFHASLL
ncbi:MULTISPECIES: hypothetical protein [Chryseobacterium]|uniref:Uncharacterized protein n=1 Tax=Chryseobacterium geocarposphaerae TaxID=1416776 RepID=A0ABU1LFD8_9FLAO|nr:MULTISPECIES: hypothetical protein [Chryseobacterium]MDR6405442.1 hypothetical protein [Chryseobacterium geocarposphaerae]MDR6697601.1 hypothetical protein [Chryseobacterium ginsenosidimutans]